MKLFAGLTTGFLGIVISAMLFSSTALAVDCNAVRAKYSCPVQKKNITLSFDDGIADVTPKVLDILKRKRVNGVFFVLGNKIDCGQYRPACVAKPGSQACQSYQSCLQRRQTLKRMKREGHIIGAHGYTHDRHSELSPMALEQNIVRSRQILAPFLSTSPAVYRLPYGDGWFNQQAQPQVMAALKRHRFEHIGWEMTAYDWNVDYQKGDVILDNVMGQMCKGRGRQGVVLFHDGDFEKEHEGRHFTADNLSRWIDTMRCAANFVPLTHYRKTLKLIR